MLSREEHIKNLQALGQKLKYFAEHPPASVHRTAISNPWLTKENYCHALLHWSELLTAENLNTYVKPYTFHPSSQKIGIIMAGNIPLVGFHDLISVILSGKTAICKLSSDDAYVIPDIIQELRALNPLYANLIEIVEKVKDVDAVIATGSNNSFRYFEYYFRDIPSVLRKNRKSMAVLDKHATHEELQLLAKDIFTYYGLGCRNVSLIFIPEGLPVEKVIDNFSPYQHYLDHNKYANNYTYHKALALINGEKHLDSGFMLIKEDQNLNAPLACVNICTYNSLDEVKTFINTHKEDIQCISTSLDFDNSVSFGDTQTPALNDFADNVDTMLFLQNLTIES